MLLKYFPFLLLEPDANGSQTGGSSTPGTEEEDTTAQEQVELSESEVAAKELSDATATAIETVQKATTVLDEKDKVDVNNLQSPEAKAAEDGLVPKKENETAEEKATREAAEAKAKLNEPKVDKDGDDKLPFNNHPRWKEVIAQRDTATTELTQFKQQYEQAKPLAERQVGIEQYCRQNNLTPENFQELLQVRALMNTDPAKALEVILPMVASLQALAGKGIAPDLLQEVKDGLLTEARAQELTQARAVQTRGQQSQQTYAQQQRQAVVAQMEQSVNSWFTTKQTVDPAFQNKVALVNGIFASLAGTTPPNSPAEVTAMLEKAYLEVNNSLEKFAPKPPERKAPPRSNSSRTAPKEPETMEEYAKQLVDSAMETV